MRSMKTLNLQTMQINYLRTEDDPKMRPPTKAETEENHLVAMREAMEVAAVLAWAKAQLAKHADYESAASLRNIAETVLKPYANHPIIKARRHHEDPTATWSITTNMSPQWSGKKKAKKKRGRK